MKIRRFLAGQNITGRHAITRDVPGSATPPPPSSGPSSILFNGGTGGQINYVADNMFEPGTGDFTVEWWQYHTDSNGSPRPWGIGPWPTSRLAVSLESGGNTFYMWVNNASHNFGSIAGSKNQWVHYAVSRSGGVIRAFKNGTQIGANWSNGATITLNGAHLTLGGEGGTYSSQTFGGNITNWRYSNIGRYTGGFTVPSAAFTVDSNTVALLLATNATTYGDLTPTNLAWSDGGGSSSSTMSPF